MNNEVIQQVIARSRDSYSRQCLQVVDSYYDFIDDGNSEFLNLFHPNATYKRPGYELLCGREQLAVFYATTRVIAQGQHRPSNVFAEGLGVAIEGIFQGILRDGAHVTVPFSDFFLFDGGDVPPRIVTRRTYFDDVNV